MRPTIDSGKYFWILLSTAALGASVSIRLLCPQLSDVPTLLTAVGIMAVAGAIRDRRQWQQPLNKLHDLYVGVCKGRLPLDEMATATSQLSDEMSRIGNDLYEAVRDGRESRRTISTLENEMRDRVASRTNALERQLSSSRIQASKDVLTGLHNRRTLEQTFPELFEKCRADGKDLAVLAMDVDRFKLLNDTLGHAAGDQFLRSIGQILSSGVRACDVPIRLGGDEFLILLPGCGIEAAKSLGGRLATLVGTLSKTLKMPEPPGLSVGAKSLKELPSSATPQELLEAADRELYAVKSDRRRAA